ncbi:unnamed protein product, partial [Mesorhabditis spiculigera]
MESETRKKNASPRIQRRAPVSSASPVPPRKHVYFGGFSPNARKNPEFEEVEARFPPAVPGSNPVTSQQYSMHYASQDDLRRRNDADFSDSLARQNRVNRHVTHVTIREPPSPSRSSERRDAYGVNGYVERADESMDPRLRQATSSVQL